MTHSEVSRQIEQNAPPRAHIPVARVFATYSRPICYASHGRMQNPAQKLTFPSAFTILWQKTSLDLP